MSGEASVPDDVAALLASLEGAERANRRRHERTATKGHARAVVRRVGSGQLRVTVKDLSCSGLGVYAQGPMEIGEQVEVGLEGLKATCRVAVCRLEPDGRYIVGLEFVAIARVAAQGGLSDVLKVWTRSVR